MASTTDSTAQMAPPSCPTCGHQLKYPPTLYNLLKTYPKICPTFSFPRHKLRCKWCDEVTANKKAIDAELPPPDHTSPVKKIEADIALARTLIWEGIRKEELEATLPRMQEMLREEIKARDHKIEKAWEEFRGIWGMER